MNQNNEEQKADHDMNTNETNNTGLLINTADNNNAPPEQAKEESKESSSLTTNGLSSSPLMNGKDINNGFVGNGTPDLLGNLSNDETNILIDTQKPHDTSHQDEKIMNE